MDEWEGRERGGGGVGSRRGGASTGVKSAKHSSKYPMDLSSEKIAKPLVIRDRSFKSATCLCVDISNTTEKAYATLLLLIS